MNLAARRRLRLRLRDLAAASAFAAVGLSGSVPGWVAALFGVAFVASIFGRRPLATQRAWAVLTLLVIGLVLFGLVFRGQLDLVVAAVSFAALVTAHRLVSEPSPTTDQQVLLASLLLMAGAAALSGELSFAVCLLAFGVFSCLHLGLTVVEGPIEREEDLPMAPVLRQVSLGVGLALLGGIAFFVLFPRLSWNLASRRSTPGLLGGATGMSDRVRLGGGGEIKTSARAVLRARLEPDPGVERLDQYWIGRRFDVFDGREWRGSGVDGAPGGAVHLANASSGQVVQRIELLPAYGARTLVALAHPASFSQPIATNPTGSGSAQIVNSVGEEVRFVTPAPSYAYTAISVRGSWLRQDEQEYQRALALPAVDPRVEALARRVAGSETDPHRQARLIEAWLQSNYGYTLELEGEVSDPLAAFLFSRKEGHCEHFATALAVMLRTLKVPARIAAGFYGGERSADRYVVRAGDAHAWVEVWFDDEGWVTLDATPADSRRARPPAVLARLSEAYERLEELWRSRVVDYSFLDQVRFARDLVRPPRQTGPTDDQPSLRWPPALSRRALGTALAMLVAAAVWRALGRRRQRPRPNPATSFLNRLERRLVAAHIPRHAHESLETLAQRLRAARHPRAGAVSRATRRYLEARFGARPLSRPEARALLDAVHPK